MQAARLLHQLAAGAHGQMIGVGKDDPGAHIAQFPRSQGFYRCLRAHRHENRGVDVPMRGMQNAGPGAGVFILMNQGKRNRHNCLLMIRIMIV